MPQKAQLFNSPFRIIVQNKFGRKYLPLIFAPRYSGKFFRRLVIRKFSNDFKIRFGGLKNLFTFALP
jgi:hypothetical protein